MTEYNFGGNVQGIGQYACYNCIYLTSVTIPKEVTEIGSYAFSNCYRLTSVTLNSNAVASKTYDRDYTLGNIFGSQVREYIFGEDVKSIGRDACYNLTSLQSVTIGKNVTEIYKWAFEYCSGLTKAEFASIESLCGLYFANVYANPLYYAHHLYIDGKEVTDVVIPESVTRIGSYTFSGCSNLASVTINSNTIASMNYSSSSTLANIFGSQVKEYIWGEEVTKIGQYACYNCSKLNSITIPNSVTSIGYEAFEGCSSLTSITIPVGVTSIGSSAFSNCSNLTKAEFASIESLCEINFGNSWANPLSEAKHLYINGKEVTDVVIPNSVTSIGSYAFSGCSGLTSVVIPESVTTIGGYAFDCCSGLTSITIPNSVTSIGVNAFYNTAWYNNQPDGLIYAGKVAYKYKGTMSFGTKIVLDEGTVSVCENAFKNYYMMTSITIPNSVTEIGENAFTGCSGLTSISIKCTSAPEDLFKSCTAVEKLEVGVATLASSPLGMTLAGSLKEVNILDGVKEIGADAFKDCTNLERVSFESAEGLLGITFGNGYANPLCQNKVLNIGDKIVSELVIPESVTSVNNYALFNCRSIKKVTGGENVKSIGVGAFSGNVKLSELHLGSSVKKIGNEAFSQCPLTTIYSYAVTPPTCGNNVFTINAENCKLYVPEESVSKYQNHQDWYEFNIQAMKDETGIETLRDEENEEMGNATLYDLQGRRIMKPTRGIYVRNGKKVAIK